MRKEFAGHVIEDDKVFDETGAEVDEAKAKRIIAYVRIEEIEVIANKRQLLPLEASEYLTLKIRMGL